MSEHAESREGGNEAIAKVWVRRKDQREFLLERDSVWYLRARDDSGVWKLPDWYGHGHHFYQARGKGVHDLVVCVGRRAHLEEQCEDEGCEYDHFHHVHAVFLAVPWEDIRPAEVMLQNPWTGWELR